MDLERDRHIQGSGTELYEPGRKPRDLPEAGELQAWINERAVAEYREAT